MRRLAGFAAYFHHPAARDALIFLALIALSAIMMWPWVLHLRDAMSDRGDAYAIVYWLWWDYHQTFHNPVNLFHATAFYPYRYTMAFTENDYGVALLCFPLFALGLHPMTVHSIATFLAFPFAGYGMFRLTRTLTGRRYAAWVAAIVFAFLPYHFQRLPHLHLLMTAWLPLTLEALVLFARQPTRRRAVWLIVAFTMNALTAVTWLILSLIPLLLSLVLLIVWYRLYRNRVFWIRFAGASLVGVIGLLPFLFPFYRVHNLYGFVRSADDVNKLSADPIHWLAISGRNKLWVGLGGDAARDEFTLFPGFIPPLLALMAVLVVAPIKQQQWFNSSRRVSAKAWRRFQRYAPTILDCSACAFLIVALLAIGWNGIHFNWFGHELFGITDPVRPLMFCVFTLIIRSAIAPPEFFLRFANVKKFGSMIIASPFSLPLAIAGIWGLTGFLGSFGMHFVFHRTLYNYVPLFQSMRAPVRWATICYVGLALAAGIGAERLKDAISRRDLKLKAVLCVAIVILILFEQRVAPIEFVRGEVEPDAITLRLKTLPMSGGIVELPAERDNYAYYRYMLRGADHGRPFVTASASFAPPIVQDIEALTLERPIPQGLLDLFERIPVSYLVVHRSLLNSEGDYAIENFLSQATKSGRLKFINSFGDEHSPDELYALTKTEPEAKPEATRDIAPSERFLFQQYADILNREPSLAEAQQWGERVRSCRNDQSCVHDPAAAEDLALLQSPEFHNKGGLIFNLYRIAFARRPSYAEWARDRQELALHGYDSFAEEWMKRPEFLERYPASLNIDGFSARLAQAGDPQIRLKGSSPRSLNRAQKLFALASASPAAVKDNESFVALCYFIFLNREPDREGIRFWAEKLQHGGDETVVIRGFIYANEYRSRLRPNS